MNEYFEKDVRIIRITKQLSEENRDQWEKAKELRKIEGKSGKESE